MIISMPVLACDPDDESYQGMNEISVNRFLSLGQLAKLVRSSVKKVKVVIFIPNLGQLVVQK